jgi:proteic killer suppression protein
MIRGFHNKGTEARFNRKLSKKFPSDIQRTALRKLIILDSAESLNDLQLPPSNRLEKLLGDRKGQYSIRINERRRICFKWLRRDAYDVEIVDYHD